MKRKYVMICLAAAMLSLTACGGSKTENTDTDTAVEEADEKASEEVTSNPVLYANLTSTLESLGEYKGLEATKNVAEVTDEEVQKEVRSQKNSYAEAVTVDRPAEGGDIVLINFTGYVDGETSDGLQGTDFSLELGSGQFVPGFEDQLIGAVAESEVEVNITFPEDYYEDLAGKDAMFEVYVQSVQEYQLDDWSDEFVKENLGYDSIADMEASIRAELESTAEEDAQANLESELVSQLLSGCKFNIEDSDVEAYVDQMMGQYETYAQMYGVDLETFLQNYVGTTEEEMREAYRPSASYRVQMTLAFHAIAEQENLTVSEEEYQTKLAEYAELYNYEDVNDVEETVGRELLEEQVEQEMVLDFILENAVIS